MARAKILRNCFFTVKDKNGEVITHAYFHKFMVDSIETDNGVKTYPVAIVELYNGQIKVIDAESITMTMPPTN